MRDVPYMSGYNGYSLGLGQASPFDLGAVSHEVQWEAMLPIVALTRTTTSCRAIGDMELRLLLNK